MNTKQILVLLLAYAAALSGVLTYLELNGIVEPDWFAVGTALLSSLLIFCWYWSDSTARSYRRSPLLNIAMISVSFIAIPYYLVRSRVKGERLKSFGKLVGFVACILLVVVVGGLSVVLFS